MLKSFDIKSNQCRSSASKKFPPYLVVYQFENVKHVPNQNERIGSATRTESNTSSFMLTKPTSSGVVIIAFPPNLSLS